jgi:hypothetical protein
MFVNPRTPSLESPAQLARHAARVARARLVAEEKAKAARMAAYCSGHSIVVVQIEYVIYSFGASVSFDHQDRP